MTPFELRHDLAVEIGTILNHMNFKNQEGKDCKINMIEQNLPIQKDDDDIEPYPYVLVKISDGDIPEDGDKQTVSMDFVIGIYYDEEDSQGANVVLNVIQDIIERFRKYPILNKKFIMQQKIKWALQEDDTHPYYFGGMVTNWTVPLIQREGIYS